MKRVATAISVARHPAQVTGNTWGAGCAYVGETLTSLKDSIAHFGTQAEQIHNAQNLAYTLANFSVPV